MKAKTSKNEIVLQGRIIGLSSGRSATTITLCTGYATKKASYPRVICLNNAKKEADTFSVGDRVRITAEFRNLEERYARKNHQYTAMFAVSVTKPTTILERAFGDLGKFAPGENSFRLEGELVRAVRQDKNVYCTVKSTAEKNPVYVSVTSEAHSDDEAQDCINAIGKQVRVCGFVRAMAKHNEVIGKSVYKQYYVSSEFFVPDKAEA